MNNVVNKVNPNKLAVMLKNSKCSQNRINDQNTFHKFLNGETYLLPTEFPEVAT